MARVKFFHRPLRPTVASARIWTPQADRRSYQRPCNAASSHTRLKLVRALQNGQTRSGMECFDRPASHIQWGSTKGG
jgi:hypothetical protein